MQAKISSIDFEKRVVLSDLEDISYDYLILATGARTNFFSFIEGLREHSYGVKFLNRAYNFRKEFEDLLYQKLNIHNSELRKPKNIAIGGAGLSGVEVAAEMAYVISEYEKTLGHRVKNINVYLIDASETILPGNSEYVIKNTTARLKKLGVHILTNAFISKVDENKISFKEGDDLEYCFMVFTGGIKAAPINESIECEKNRINQLIVDKSLNIGKYREAFAIGDCIEVKDTKGNLLPPTAQIAERSAEYVAKAILSRINKKEPEPFNANVMGIFVALGGKYAVGEVFKYIKVNGYKAYLLKKAITYAYYIGLKLRINTGFKNRSKKKSMNKSNTIQKNN